MRCGIQADIPHWCSQFDKLGPHRFAGCVLLLGLFSCDKCKQRTSFFSPYWKFWDILAGHVARSMGLPIKQLILATNENNVLEEFFNTGIYRPRKGSEVAVTSSPSMDISKASNFERYVFDLVGRDRSRMWQLWDDLQTKGVFDISGSLNFTRISETGIIAGSSTHAERLETIRSVHEVRSTHRSARQTE